MDWTWEGGCQREELLHLERFGEYQGLLEIPDDEGGLFQNAWFQGVLYFERLSALILLKRGDSQCEGGQ